MIVPVRTMVLPFGSTNFYITNGNHGTRVVHVYVHMYVRVRTYVPWYNFRISPWYTCTNWYYFGTVYGTMVLWYHGTIGTTLVHVSRYVLEYVHVYHWYVSCTKALRTRYKTCQK